MLKHIQLLLERMYIVAVSPAVQRSNINYYKSPFLIYVLVHFVIKEEPQCCYNFVKCLKRKGIIFKYVVVNLKQFFLYLRFLNIYEKCLFRTVNNFIFRPKHVDGTGVMSLGF